MSKSTILVSGLPKDVDKNDLQIYFQCKSQSGGGEIASMEIDTERSEARIEYVDPSVADIVIARTHEYKGSHLTVQKYGPSTDEYACLLVSGLSDKCTKDALEVYFESARRSGGGDVTDVQMKGNEAIVTFASKDVAKRVLSRTHEYQGCQLTVQEYKSPTHECSILVSGLSNTFTKDALELYFESNRRSGGGDVTNVQMKGDKAVITFVSADVVKQVLARTHEYQGCQLTVQEYKPPTDKYAVVVVRGFSSNCTKDALEMYFESTRRSGGGEVNDVEMRGDNAIVTFASAEVAKRVLSRTHEYQGCQLTVREYLALTDECTSVMVSGLSEKCTKDALEVYFENARRSGGGEIIDVQMKGDKAIVTFACTDVAKRVLSRTHEYQGCQLTVQEYKSPTHECSILVSGLSNTFTKDALELYFESNRRSGGGDVTNVQMQGDKAVVTFASADVVKQVLARTHEYQGCQLTVQEYKPPTDKYAVVVVRGFSSNCTKDALEMYFESTRRSGGGEVNDVEMRGDNAIVTFASAEVAKRVLSRTHEYQGCQLTVREYLALTDECTSVMVSGLSEKCTKDALEVYFENARRSGGGEIIDVQMKGDKAIVTFACTDAAKRVLSKTHEYQGCQLTVQEYKPPKHECSILVSGLSNNFTKDALEMYFESTRRSGGHVVTDVQMKDDKAVVTFESSDVAKRVLSRTHRYQGCQLTVQEYKPCPEEAYQEEHEFPSTVGSIPTEGMTHRNSGNDQWSGGGEVMNIQLTDNQTAVDFASPVPIVSDSDFAPTESMPLVQKQMENKPVTAEKPLPQPMVVRVLGDPDKLTEDNLSIIFTNKRLSGGGKIDEIKRMPKEGVADITFRSSEDAEEVARKKSLEFDGARFTMVLKKNISKDPKTFHVTGLSDISEEKFIEIMEHISDEKVEDFLFGSNQNAVVTFGNPPDPEQIHKMGSTKTPNGVHLTIEQANLCDCIEVTGLAPDTVTNKDILKFYFDNTRNGGGEVKNVEMDSDEKTRALVYFEDPKVVNSVTKKHHVLKGAKLKVVPYYPVLYQSSAETEGGKQERIVKVDPQNMLFIKEFLSQEFEQLLQENRVTYTWEEGSGEIVLGCAKPKMDKKIWEKSCEGVVAYVNQIITGKITVSEEAWSEMKEKAEDEFAPFKDQVAIMCMEKECSYTLTGKKSDVQVLVVRLKFLNQGIQKGIEIERNKASDTVNLTEAEVELFSVSGLVENLQDKCKDLEVKLLENDGKLSLRGPDAAVRIGKEMVLQAMAKERERETDLPKAIVDIICSNQGKMFMKMQLKEAHINAVFGYDTFNGTELMVTAMSRKELKTAVKLIRDLTSEQSIPLDDHEKQLTKSEKWKELKHSIQQEMLVKVKEEPEACTLWIAGIKEEVEKAREKVHDFFKDNNIIDEMVGTESSRVTYIFKHKLNAIQNIESSLKHFSVKITKIASDKSGTILVSGAKEGVKHAASQVKELLKGIKSRQVDLGTQGIRNLFRDQKGKILLSGVENNHNCIIELCKEEDESEPFTTSVKDSGEAKKLLEGVCSYVTLEGKKITLYKGDLTKHEVDVVVNPVNEKVKLDGGVGKKILENGGQGIQDECNAHVRQNGDLKCTETLTTGAGTLHCKKLVHAVSPKWSPFASKTGSKEQEHLVSLLTQTVYNSLKKSETFSSIAIPAIGAGGAGFPAGICARALIEGALEYSKTNPSSKLSEIHFIDMNDSVIKALHHEINTKFGQESSSTNKVVPKLEPKPTIGREPVLGNVDDDSNSLTTPHGMDVKIVIDDLAKMKTHAVVNTVASDLDLSKNPCAKALSSAAGPGLQKKCKSKGSLSAGEMFVTDGYDLVCRNVFHVVVPDWQNGKGEKMMRSLIKSCLKEADKKRFSSISFPAIGTGNLGYPRDVVARAFFEEADAFKRETPQIFLQEVQIVLFHTDQTSVQVFQREIKNRKTKPKLKSKKKGKRHLYKGSSSGAAPLLGPVRLEILPGDISQEKTNAIAIPTTTNLKLTSAGKVGIVIKEKGGPGIQQECDQLGTQDAGSVVCTSAGSLPSTKIFHLVFGFWLPVKRMTEILVKCFIQADAMGITSIAVPAIGTGKGGMNPKEAAKALLSAVERFAQGNPSSLNYIRIVVFPSHMITDFQNAIHDLSESKAGKVSSFWNGIKTGVKGIFGMGEDSEAVAKLPKSTSDAINTAFSPLAHKGKMWLKVFADSHCDLDRAEASIQELARENSRELTIKHNGIGKLSDSMIERIQKMADLPNIEKIQLDKANDLISIWGDNTVDLNKATSAIYAILNEKTEEEHTRRYAELLSENVQWQYMDDGRWEYYDDDSNALIEKAYKDKNPTIAVLLIEEDNDKPSYYEIDFSAMTETNLETSEITKVERKSKATGIVLPVHWDPQPTDNDGKELEVCLVPLDPKKREHSKEYDDVKKAVEKTLSMNIVKIERVQNPSRYRAYMSEKEEMDKKNGSNEKKLFHGTDAETCKFINHKGFNRSYCGKNATVFGKGVYFARDASYSAKSTYSPPDASGNRYMYLASVLVGEYTKGSHGLLEPPPKDPKVPTVTFGSVVNNVSNPEIFVVFQDNQNYPEYLITFK